MVKCGVLFEVWTESLNIIQTGFGFKEMVSKFQVATAYFSCSLPYLNSSKFTPCCGATKLINFSNYFNSQ
jgi:hypothetical protein